MKRVGGWRRGGWQQDAHACGAGSARHSQRQPAAAPQLPLPRPQLCSKRRGERTTQNKQTSDKGRPEAASPHVVCVVAVHDGGQRLHRLCVDLDVQQDQVVLAVPAQAVPPQGSRAGTSKLAQQIRRCSSLASSCAACPRGSRPQAHLHAAAPPSAPRAHRSSPAPGQRVLHGRVAARPRLERVEEVGDHLRRADGRVGGRARVDVRGRERVPVTAAAAALEPRWRPQRPARLRVRPQPPRPHLCQRHVVHQRGARLGEVLWGGRGREGREQEVQGSGWVAARRRGCVKPTRPPARPLARGCPRGQAAAPPQGRLANPSATPAAPAPACPHTRRAAAAPAP